MIFGQGIGNNNSMADLNYNPTNRKSVAYETRKNTNENLKSKSLERIISLALTSSLFILFNNYMVSEITHWYFT